MARQSFNPEDLSAAPPGWQDDLLAAFKRYETDHPHYDEVLDETGARIREAGEASKADIGVLVFWKRSGQGNWTAKLLDVPDERVRSVTRAAFAARDDEARLATLSELPGFKQQEAIATTVLCAYDPIRYAVMDWRVLKALDDWGLGVGQHRGKTLRYLARVRAIRDDISSAGYGEFTARDMDKGLWMLNKRST